jgi:murein DD-endopeptidase MepM/ murein hydrolase activator NlpD
MPSKTIASMKDGLEHLFPERQVYIRTGSRTKGYVVTTGQQIILSLVLTFLVFWLIISTVSVLIIATLGGAAAEKQLIMARAQSERLVADRQARLDDATKEFSNRAGSLDQMADMIEKRHGALIQILRDFKNVPGATAALTPTKIDHNLPAIERIFAVSAEQERMVAKGANLARTRAERLRIAFRMAGLNPAGYSSGGDNPLVTKDSQSLALMLDVDQSFADRIRNAAVDLNDMRQLQRASESIPFDRPTLHARQTSGFGIRFDPFNHRPKPHNGLDFADRYLTPILSTAPGVVSFAGVRNGYGNTVEIDHGNGFKTRYAHMAAFAVRQGQRIGIGQRIGAMGNTGRSTAVHLHYEVWNNGRPQNPARYLKAGEYVQQN